MALRKFRGRIAFNVQSFVNVHISTNDLNFTRYTIICIINKMSD